MFATTWVHSSRQPTWRFLLFVSLKQTENIELENMEFVYKRNENINGCFLSKKGNANPCNTEEMEVDTSCSSLTPPSFDLSGRWVDVHAIDVESPC